MRRALNGLDIKKVERKEKKCKHFLIISPKEKRVCFHLLHCRILSQHLDSQCKGELH